MNNLGLTVEKDIWQYLKKEIFPRLAPPPYGEIKIKMLSYQKPVYLFYEKTKNIMVVGKLFKNDSIPLKTAWLWAENEYSNLKLLREKFGMESGAYRVVAPLGKNKNLSALLATERAPGKILDYYIAKAIYEQESQRLFDTLNHLAKLFAKLHRNSQTDRQASSNLPQWYLNKLLNSLRKGPLSSRRRNTIQKHATKWWNKDDIFADKQVIVHGDATPTNFLFHHGEVIGIDLEHVKWADRCWDLGFMAAELKHHFMWRMGDGWAAEPFIGHFLWEYAVNYGDTQLFYAITRKTPLYMALGLLRIARNGWLDEPYRKILIREAKRCLKYGL